MENKIDFSDPVIEEILAPLLDGVLYNWDTLASVTRASVALRFDRLDMVWVVLANAPEADPQAGKPRPRSPAQGISPLRWRRRCGSV